MEIIRGSAEPAGALRVLVIDDSPLALQTIKALLERMDGIGAVETACNGEDGLELISQLQPDLAVVDVHMSGLNGLETCAGIVMRFPKVRVVLMTAHGSAFRQAAFAAGALEFLAKPRLPLDLPPILKQLLVEFGSRPDDGRAA